MMSKEKYPSIIQSVLIIIFSSQMEAIAFIICILQIFFATGIRGISPDVPWFSWGIFSNMMHLDQSCASEKISQIIICNNQ